MKKGNVPIVNDEPVLLSGLTEMSGDPSPAAPELLQEFLRKKPA